MAFPEKSPSFIDRSRLGLLDSAVMILFTVIALIIAGLVTPEAAASGGSLDVVASVLRVASPAAAVWVVLALAIGLLPRVGVTGRAALATSAAVVASLAVSVSRFGSIAFLTGGAGLISVIGLGVSTVGFSSVVAIGCFGAAVFLSNRRGARPRAAAAIVVALLLAVGAAAASALVSNWLNLYFRFSPTTTPPTARDADSYLRSAGVVVAVPIVCLVIAIVVKARSLVVLSAVLLVGWALAAVILAVPQGRFAPHPASPSPANSNYHPCYSGSNNCEGG